VIKTICSKLIIKNYLLIFDLDGTLVNTDEVNFLSYKEAIKITKDLDLDFLHDTSERFTRDKLYSIMDDLTAQEYENIIEIKNNVYQKYLHKSKINDYVLKFVERFSGENKIVLATNSHKDRAKMVLSYHDLIKFFDYIFYKEDYGDNNKFTHVLYFFNISPNLVIIFENDEEEIRKAIFSGIQDKNIINIFNMR